MNETVLTWGNVIAIAGVIISLFSVGSGIFLALYKQIRGNKTELDEFKLEVARSFVSNTHLNGMKEDLIRSEERTLAAINNLADRFDRFLAKNS